MAAAAYFQTLGLRVKFLKTIYVHIYLLVTILNYRLNNNNNKKIRVSGAERLEEHKERRL